MAMKLDSKNFIMKVLVLICALILGACAGSGAKSKKAQTKNAAPDLVSTAEYIPVPKADNAGGFLPYEAKENPYTALKGKIKQESIVRYIEAKRAFKQKQYGQADQLLKQLTKDDKSLSGPWVTLGDVAVEQKNLEQAVSYYSEAILRNNKNVNAYMKLAQAQRMQGKFLNAQNTYAKALQMWPDFPEAHLNLAVLYDIYLNHPIRAQKHMEAYQFLTHGENKTVSIWLAEIQQRTGVPLMLNVQKKKAESVPLS
jgi:tetratricopeptide (TPR) repeat protein